MEPVNSFTISLLLLLVVGLATASTEKNNSTEKNATQATGRSGRKDYSVYSRPDTYASKKPGNYYPSEESGGEDEIPSGFEPSIDPGLTKDDPAPSGPLYSPPNYDEYVPESYYKPALPPRPRYYTPGPPMYKSASSVNWNVWKGDPMDTGATAQAPNNNKGGQPADFGEFYFPADTWKGDPWTPDQMSNMMMMMNQMQAANKPKFGGLLSKLTQDPATLAIAVILPFSLILAAVLPTLVNMMMNGGLPTITTTATGNTGRNLDGVEYLTPVIQTISAFGSRSFDHPDCMQKIFCQVTRGSSGNGTESRSFQKALYSASRLIDSHWLESFGVKTLFDSMADGDCDRIPCSTHNPVPRAEDKAKKSYTTVDNSG